MLMWALIILSYVAAIETAAQQESLEVKLKQGTVRGHLDATGELYVFYNIPYATAPTGEHKFKAPLPPPIWTEIFDAVNRGIVCPQFIVPGAPPGLVMQEDCLVVNVHVPAKSEGIELSVLVNIHGGSFQIGFGEIATITNLMKTNDFIFVTFNYRLGIHGFLCMGTKDIPGNAGMKDQLALLHWVKQNIAAFGGNPNDVTIDGQSAGAIAVDLLMISRTTNGLFQKAVTESSVSLSPFSMQADPLQNAKDHAIKLGFKNVDDTYALEKFYKTLSYAVLTSDLFGERTDSTFVFVPCVERRDTGAQPFITEAPLTILKSGSHKNLPMLYGITNMEGLLRINLFDDWKNKMNINFADFLPADLKFESDVEKLRVAQLIKQIYFGTDPINNANVLGYVGYFSDLLFVHPTLWAVKLYAQAGHKQIYLYEYSFFDENTPVVPYTDVRGAGHTAQSIALADGNENNITSEYKAMKKSMRELWHNFIKNGKPVPEGSSLPTWPAADLKGSPYMSLGRKIELRCLLSENVTLFWDNIYKKYYRLPIPPPKPHPKPMATPPKRSNIRYSKNWASILALPNKKRVRFMFPEMVHELIGYLRA